MSVAAPNGEDVLEGSGVGKTEFERRRVRGNSGNSTEDGGIEAEGTAVGNAGRDMGGNVGVWTETGSTATEDAEISEGGAGGKSGGGRDRNRFSILLKGGTGGC